MKVFYRFRFIESPSLLFFMTLTQFTQYSAGFLQNFLTLVYQVVLFSLLNLMFKYFMIFIPKPCRYPAIMVLATTLMSLSYFIVMAIQPNLTANYYLFFAFSNALMVVIAAIDYGYYRSVLAESFASVAILAIFLLLFLSFTLILSSLLSGSLLKTLPYQIIFWQSLSGRLLILAALMALLKTLLRREP